MAKICPYYGIELEKISYNEWFCPGCVETFFSESHNTSITEADALSGWDDDEEDEDDW